MKEVERTIQNRRKYSSWRLGRKWEETQIWIIYNKAAGCWQEVVQATLRRYWGENVHMVVRGTGKEKENKF